MATIKIVQKENSKTPHDFKKRLGWFILIWAGSAISVMALSSLLHMLIPH